MFTRPDDEQVTGCPNPAAPLSELEQSMVGLWRYSDNTGDTPDIKYLTFTANRGYRETQFQVDPDGTFHATTFDGTEVETAVVSFANGRLRWCQANECTPFSRER